MAMTDAVAHRGPDAGGYYLDGGIGLGHRRLSIIDLATGDQPIGNEDGSVQVVFNGEIYNFAEVRARARSRTATASAPTPTPKSSSTATSSGASAASIASAACSRSRCGTRSARRLLLARDRLGVKPLYYAEVPGGLVFGSEIKSLLEDPEVPREWRADALDAYLTLLYIPAPDTIYRGIHKLPPAHVLVAERGQVRISRYWDLEFTGDGDARREEDYLEELDAPAARSRRRCA